MQFDLSVIIPCYNERLRLANFATLIGENAELQWEWVFVDDGSTDGTAEFIASIQEKNANVKLVRMESNHGKGKSVKEGFANASGKIVGYIDADLAASPLEFQRFLDDPQLITGDKIVAGIRLKTQRGNVHRLLYRHIIGRIFQTYASLMTGITVYDTQCGFKLMATPLARRIAEKMRCDGFAFDVELLLIGHQIGIEIREEVISWSEKGNTSIRPHHILQMAVDIWRIRRWHGVGK